MTLVDLNPVETNLINNLLKFNIDDLSLGSPNRRVPEQNKLLIYPIFGYVYSFLIIYWKIIFINIDQRKSKILDQLALKITFNFFSTPFKTKIDYFRNQSLQILYKSSSKYKANHQYTVSEIFLKYGEGKYHMKQKLEVAQFCLHFPFPMIEIG